MQFAFGDYVLDPDRRELTRGSEAIAMGPQVFDLLFYLVQNCERAELTPSRRILAEIRDDCRLSDHSFSVFSIRRSGMNHIADPVT